jgi:hypothetical protein
MNEPIMRCKLRVNNVLHSKNADGSTNYEDVELSAVYDGSEENKQFSKYTPSASFKVHISNPQAFNKLSNGHEYYVDFTPTS